jgi:hypothetical protein
MPIDRTELLLTKALLLREDLVDRMIERERAEAGYYKAIRRLHNYGLPLRWIAQEVRLSHQRVHQIVSNPQRVLERQRRRALPFKMGTPWSFSNQTSAAIDRAELEARQHRHASVDLEHFILGLALVADPTFAQAPAALGIDEPKICAIIASSRQDGDPIPANRPLPIAARARVATELARREADRLHSKQLLPEHLLVGVALVGDALDDSFLREAGVTANRVRAAFSA